MKNSDNFSEKLYQIVKKSGFVPEEALEEVYKASIELNRPLADILVFKGLISEEVLSQLVAESLQLPFISLRNRIIPDELLDLIPENLARRYRMIAFEKTPKALCVAMADPENFEAIEILKKRTDFPILPYFASISDISRAFGQYKKDIKKEFENIISENIKKASVINGDAGAEKLLEVASDLPVIKILDAILEYAMAENASDLHFEILHDLLIVRLRVDGVLRDILTLPKEIEPAIVARIKVLSNLKIDEHRFPQDGRFRFQLGEIVIGLRVSIIPAFFGENIVLRLLPESERPLSLQELGLTGRNLEIIERNIKKPNGMILVTGPTGSGKTTTLYSILNMLNTVKVKICTVEDPVEYHINRISQIQINPKTGLDFSMGLRALLRHDPDIIMVGEIRDEETVNMAVHSALTGHLVLSTLHTNDAPSSIIRLLDMGAEGYLLTSTVNVAVAQRLVRRICPSCIEKYNPPKELIDSVARIFGDKFKKQQFYHGKGCEKCHNRGYRGRVGIYEVLEVNDEIRRLILKKSSSEEIRKEAVRGGMTTMLEDGLDKIAAGVTTIEELLAAVRE